MINELSQTATSQMAATLTAGLNTLDADEKLVFLRYTRVTLPLDGFVYWIRDTIAIPLIVEGSLHYSTQTNQNEDENIAINAVVLTTNNPVQDLNDLAPNTIYIGKNEAGDIRFAFSSTGKFFQQSNLWHYRGDAIYPAMFSQIIDNPTLPISIPQIATNSLPIWLNLAGIQNGSAPTVINFNSLLTTPAVGDVLQTLPPRVSAQVVNVSGNSVYVAVNVGAFVAGDGVYNGSSEVGIVSSVSNGIPTIYPSFLIPANLPPPYIGIDIPDTGPMQSTPYLDVNGNHWQLMKDKIKITIYGMNNNQAMDFLDFVNRYSLEYDNIGILNMPRVFDEKRTQSELGIIAQKKTIEIDVSYYQSRSQDIARTLILSCLPNFIFTH